MKLRYALVTLSLSVLLAAPALADRAMTFGDSFRSLVTSVPIPPEWSGVWTVTDSSWKCPSTPNGVTTTMDTLCAGQPVSAPSEGLPITMDCTGTSNATSIHMTCTGSGEVIPGCTADISMQIDGTISGSAFSIVTTVNISYVGDCFGTPDQCFITHSHGVKFSGEPASCATPTEPSTWGKVKAFYR